VRSARVFTTEGELRIELLPEVAPLTVWNFASLAEKGYFDGLVFHRVVPDFVIQTGDPRGDGWGGPGYEIPDELSAEPYATGAVGMALSGPDTGGSQWFVTLSPHPHLDYGYTVFGNLSLGQRAASAISIESRVERVVIERVN
jgi:cyclophilin family peptidyl-prolyl cis-trans isomerase